MNTQERDRFRGSLLGLATGDALGTTLEFRSPGSFQPLEDMIGGGPFGLKPGQWTDDTSMALCLAESLITCRDFDPIDQLTRYVRWYREGHLSSTGACFDIGHTVRSALHKFERTGDPFPGSEDPLSAGNGSLMRLAPVVLYYSCMPEQAIHYAGLSSRTTHSALEAVDACRFFGALLYGTLNGVTKEILLAPFYTPHPGSWKAEPLQPAIAFIAGGSYKHRQPPEIEGGGYVVPALEAALWAFYHAHSFKEGALLAVNLGNDADTTGAIYGQLAGAYYGASSIPGHWLEMLSQRDLIIAFSDDLYSISRENSGGF